MEAKVNDMNEAMELALVKAKAFDSLEQQYRDLAGKFDLLHAENEKLRKQLREENKIITLDNAEEELV